MTEKSSKGGTETVLIVEDEEAVRFLCRVVLQRAGYRVLDAENPQRAEALLIEHTDRIDLLVTDVIMPGSSGPSLHARLLVERPGLRVVYMSGYNDDMIVQHAALPPNVLFLRKPFSADDLMRNVREALDR
jgi:DNA-binding NtrC family response regulator